MKALLQALRVLNRAAESLARLNPEPKKGSNDVDPFAMSEIKESLQSTQSSGSSTTAAKTRRTRVPLDGLEWRISNALLETQLSLAQTYAVRGSAREAEYFQEQAEELARVLGSSALLIRSLILKAELKMALGCPHDANSVLEEVMELSRNAGYLNEADIHRSIGDHLVASSMEADADSEFKQAAETLTKTQIAFDDLERRISQSSKLDSTDTFAPVLQAKILRQQG